MRSPLPLLPLLPLVPRTARSQWAALLALGLLVLGTSFLAGAGPRALAAGYDRAARAAIAGASAGSADVVVSASMSALDADEAARRARSLPGSAVGLAALDRRWRSVFPAPLRRTIAGSDTFAAAPPVPIGTNAAGELTRLAVGLSSSAGAHIRYVSGRAPGPPERAAGALRLEAALPARAARRLRVKAGDVIPVRAQPGLGVRVTGLFDPADPHGDYWDAHHRYEDVEVRETRDGAVIVTGTALLSPAGYQALCADTRMPVGITWTYTPAAARITARSAPALVDGVHQASEAVANSVVGDHSATMTTRLDQLLEDFTRRLRTTRSLLSLALSGLFAAALGALALTAALLPARMRAALATQTARGASRGQSAALAAAVAGLVTVPAAGAGLLLSAAFVRGPAQVVSYAAVAALVVTAAGVPAVAAARGPNRAAGGSRRRLVAEALIVLVALGATFLLRRRGLGTGPGGADPLMPAVPALLALAAGLIVLRVHPYPLRLAGRVLARGRSAAAFIGVARASRRRAAATLPLAVLLLAVAVIGFTATVGSGLGRTQRLAAWQAAGGDARVDAQILDPDTLQRIRRTPGIRAAVPAEIIDGAHLMSGGQPLDEVTIVAVDLGAYRHAMAGTPLRLPAAPPVPAPSRGLGATVPALFSPATAGAAKGTAARGGLELTTDSGLRLTLRDAGTVARFPAQPDGTPYVVVPYDPVFRATAGRVAGSVFLRGDHLDVDALRRAGGVPLAGTSGAAAVDTYQAEHAALTGGELGRLIDAGFGVAGLLVACYGALAVVVLLLGEARERARAVSYLGALGLSRRQALRIVVAEIAPVLLVTAFAGWALGLGLPAIVGPAVDLRPYTGGLPLTPGLADLAATIPLAGGLVLFAVLAVLIDASAAARLRPGAVLRMGEI